MIKILFVCHGNICRSTMAEFVMKDLVRKANLADKFIINSAATSREEIGADTHYGTKAKLREMNIPFTKRKAVQVTKSDYDMYDYIIGEDTQHKVHKMMAFAGEMRDVKDPWYTNNFDETYADIDKGCRALLDYLRDNGNI